ncbi:MAG TPA: transposase, partial [Myxococcota bacterium]|nr:transposase [Myxococcota bacterium]
MAADGLRTLPPWSAPPRGGKMDLTEEQWDFVEPLIPKPRRRSDGRGRPWRDPRDVLDGVL